MSTFSDLEPTVQALEQRGNALLDRAETIIENGESWSALTGQNKTDVDAKAAQVSTDAATASSAKTAAEAARDSAVAIADPESAIEAAFDIWVKDKEREAFEAATGGACTIERTADGDAAHMFILPKMKWEDLVPSGELGTGVHEAFIEGGVEKSELLIGMYQAASMTGSGGSSSRLTSQPGLTPRRWLTWGNSRSAAQAAGFDIMSTWEWSAIAFWCMANGFQPRGNTNYGQSHSHPHEVGIQAYESYGRVTTRTGSGPNTWNHNNAANGIADLVGNVGEWQRGFKIVDGRIFLAPDNDKSLVESSWGDTGWDIPNSNGGNWAGFYDAQNEAPLAVRRALIMPNGVADPDGSLYSAPTGERFPHRGSSLTPDDARASVQGLGSLTFHAPEGSTLFLGFRLSRLI